VTAPSGAEFGVEGSRSRAPHPPVAHLVGGLVDALLGLGVEPLDRVWPLQARAGVASRQRTRSEGRPRPPRSRPERPNIAQDHGPSSTRRWATATRSRHRGVPLAGAAPTAVPLRALRRQGDRGCSSPDAKTSGAAPRLHVGALDVRKGLAVSEEAEVDLERRALPARRRRARLGAPHRGSSGSTPRPRRASTRPPTRCATWWVRCTRPSTPSTPNSAPDGAVTRHSDSRGLSKPATDIWRQDEDETRLETRPALQDDLGHRLGGQENERSSAVRIHHEIDLSPVSRAQVREQVTRREMLCRGPLIVLGSGCPRSTSTPYDMSYDVARALAQRWLANVRSSSEFWLGASR